MDGEFVRDLDKDETRQWRNGGARSPIQGRLTLVRPAVANDTVEISIVLNTVGTKVGSEGRPVCGAALNQNRPIEFVRFTWSNITNASVIW